MDVSVLGRIGYDLYAEQRGVPLKDVTTFSRHLGGSSANSAVGMARLGLQVGLISCLGDDPLSAHLIEYLDGEGVSTRLVQTRPGVLPSLCLTEVAPPDSFPQVFYRERAADTRLEIGDRDFDFIRSTRLFLTNGTSLCESPSRESTLAALEFAHRKGVKVAFDVDYRAMSWAGPGEAKVYARQVLPWIDILIANPEELLLITGCGTPEQGVQELRDRGVPLIVAKLGANGTLVVRKDQSYFLPPYPVPVASTVGAGDGFAAGFLFAQVRELPLPTCLQYGNAAAAIVVSRLMCADAMPRLDEVEALIRGNRGIAPEATTLQGIPG